MRGPKINFNVDDSRRLSSLEELNKVKLKSSSTHKHTGIGGKTKVKTSIKMDRGIRGYSFGISNKYFSNTKTLQFKTTNTKRVEAISFSFHGQENSWNLTNDLSKNKIAFGMMFQKSMIVLFILTVKI